MHIFLRTHTHTHVNTYTHTRRHTHIHTDFTYKHTRPCGQPILTSIPTIPLCSVSSYSPQRFSLSLFLSLSLSLSRQELPASIGLCTSLKKLDLGDNDLTTLPAELPTANNSRGACCVRVRVRVCVLCAVCCMLCGLMTNDDDWC